MKCARCASNSQGDQLQHTLSFIHRLVMAAFAAERHDEIPQGNTFVLCARKMDCVSMWHSKVNARPHGWCMAPTRSFCMPGACLLPPTSTHEYSKTLQYTSSAPHTRTRMRKNATQAQPTMTCMRNPCRSSQLLKAWRRQRNCAIPRTPCCARVKQGLVRAPF